MPAARRALLPDEAALRSARERIHGGIRTTPLLSSAWLSERAGVQVHLKLECWQVTHSFKVRGALNAVALLQDGDRDRGLVTASAGNHGLALAHAAQLHGAMATIFVPADAPATKKRRIRRLGAELREVSGGYDEAAAAARSFATETGRRIVHPFDDAAVVAGAGTVGLELIDELPDLATILVPVGGGGLAAGVGAAARALAPHVRVIGVQSDATRAMFDAFRRGVVEPTEEMPTLCDGLAGETESGAYERARAALDDLLLVPEQAVGPAIRRLYEEEGIVAEGAGVVGVAALAAGVVDLADSPGPMAVVVSGGNIDGPRLARLLGGDECRG